MRDQESSSAQGPPYQGKRFDPHSIIRTTSSGHLATFFFDTTPTKVHDKSTPLNPSSPFLPLAPPAVLLYQLCRQRVETIHQAARRSRWAGRQGIGRQQRQSHRRVEVTGHRVG